MSFVHLHVHSQYSLLEAAIQIEDLVARSKEFGMPAVALTDNGNLFGGIEFYLECKEQGLNPILGCDLFVTQDRLKKEFTKDSPPLFRLPVLATSLKGYRNLCQIISKGYTEGFYYKPRVDLSVLKEFSGDLIALSGGLLGEVPWTALNQGADKAQEKIKTLQEVFGKENFFLEISRTGAKEWNKLVPMMVELSKSTGAQLVATNDVHYLKRENAFAQDVLSCIGASKTLHEERKFKLPGEEFYFKSPEEMKKLFADLPEACERTLEIAQRCKIEFQLKDAKGNTIYHLPTYPVSEGKTPADEIREQAFKGLEKRLEESKARGEKVADLQAYHDRLDFELSVISRMGFEGYFLIVSDFIRYAKSQGIPVGPGRGSGAGSLTAYSLDITELDPLQHSLLFERFLNPERISMPDFDVDFCQDRRGEVIEYVTKKYGSDCVAQIITFGKLQAKAAIRDVGRVMAMTYGEVDAIAKLVPEKLGISLDQALEMEPRFKEWSDNDPRVANLLKTALQLEGLTRHASIHAAGVIIANRPLVEYCPLYKGNEGETVIQFDMIHAEKIGLVKFDFLGLKTLTMIRNALSNIKENRGVEIKTSQISLNDPKIYELLSRGDTAGVFQFEGDGITEFITRFKPNSFADITAINALYRPGPMNMLDEYIARKQGKIKVTYMFPELEEILKETYGIIVYQEQVQLIASKVANYSLGEADILRRAMGKKKPEEMAKQKSRFLKGALENKKDPKKAEELFDLMAKFAEYGFNKSHAAAYCVVAAQTAYLKAYYPVEFFASQITTEMSDTDKMVQYIKDAQSHGIVVKGPDVNNSQYKFVAVGEEVYFGLGGIKGVGESAVEAIVEARAQVGKFKDIQAFFETVDLRRVNKKVVECLIKAGAFDNFGIHRAKLMKNYEKLLDVAEGKRDERESGQVSLFDMAPETAAQEVALVECETWSRSFKLASEKEVLGFYLSDHPLAGLDGALLKHITCKISGLKELTPKRKVSAGGIVTTLREVITKKGTRMAFGALEDQTGQVELVIFPESFAKSELLLKSDKPLLVQGVLEVEEESAKILVDQVVTLEDVTQQSKHLLLQLGAQNSPEDIQRLKSVLAHHKGQVASSIEIDFPEFKRRVRLDLGQEFGVAPSEKLFEDLEREFGNRNMAVLQ